MGRLGEVGDLAPRRLDRVGGERAADGERLSFGALPAQLGHEAAADLEQAAVLFAALVGEPGDQRADELGLELIGQLFGHHRLGQPRAGERGDHVGVDVLLREREGVRQADHAQLHHRVVGLAEVAVDAGGRGGEDDSPVALVAQVRPGGVRHPEAAERVDAVDQVPVFLRHLVEGAVAEDAGVVDDDVDPLPGVERGLDDLRAVFDRVVVGDGLTAGGLDLLHHLVRRGAALAATGRGATQVVDHHLRAAAGQQQGVCASQAVAGAGDEGHFSVEAKLVAHRNSPGG